MKNQARKDSENVKNLVKEEGAINAKTHIPVF